MVPSMRADVHVIHLVLMELTSNVDCRYKLSVRINHYMYGGAHCALNGHELSDAAASQACNVN